MFRADTGQPDLIENKKLIRRSSSMAEKGGFLSSGRN